METFSLKRTVFILAVIVYGTVTRSTALVDSKLENTTHNCPFTRIIEDIFNINNRSSNREENWKDKRTNYLFNSTKSTNESLSKSIEDELVNDIIASIKRIKANLTNDDNNKLNEAIILKVPKDNVNNSKVIDKKVNQIKSGIEEKIDILKTSKPNQNEKYKMDDAKIGLATPTKPISQPVKSNYVEILTVEPNNTNISNKSTHNILDVLRNIMPKLNVTKDLHSITIIERNQNKNHSFTETKNISTIIVKYCEKENVTSNETVTKLKPDEQMKAIYDPDEDEDYSDDNIDYEDQDKYLNTTENRREVLVAAEYGIQKMHELYGVLEPKLYSMGLVLDEKDPARYVAAFNAPSEDAAIYAKFGYASIQAAAKLKELIGNENGDGLESRTDGGQMPAASTLRQSPLLDQCPLKGPPKCPPASKRYRTHDGTCNNLSRPRWGSTMTPVQRFIPPVYSDGIQAPRVSIFGSKLPSAREISTLVHEDKNAENTGVTHLLMQWGQFLDHDVTASSQSRGFNGSVPRCCKDGGRDFIPREFMHPECLPIAVPPTDPFYGPRGVRCLDFVRSSPAPHDDCKLGWREQFNQVSAYIDGSPVYASSARQSDKLRLFRNGMLQYGRVQQRRPLLPTDRDELCRGGAVSTDCFKSGDARVNEHPGLVAVHIVWLRQHNRMAQELAHLNPHWSDEKIYQETRKIVGAMIQHITYREFLPIVLGSEVMRLFELELLQKGFYNGYSPKINASPASAFGSAAFRFGHSLVQPSMVRFDRFHRPIPNNVSLHNELTNPSNIWSMGAVDRLLLGMVNQPIQKRDEFITEELTNHLFQTSHFGFGMDLAAINIQRGRDHGVPPYTAWREPCGLTAIGGFEDLFRVMPARAVRKLKVLYRHVNDIDMFTGGMAERPVVGGLVGPTFACIIAQQFSNLRKGDRFWYENGGLDSSLTPAQLQQIRRISLAQVLCRTLDSIDNIQPFAFLSSDNPDNDRISCRNGLLSNFDLSPWVEINSESNNDVKKSDNNERTRMKPGRPMFTTTTTTEKVNLATKKMPGETPTNAALSLKKDEELGNTINETEATVTDSSNKTANEKLSPHPIQQIIDDKLDFKFKTRRYNDFDSDTRQYNDYYDDVQSVQSVVINNLPNKRPNSRPYISVTENIDKYTYLINYVPRPTQSWRQTTKRNYDRDVVRVTYQTYDDTYRRPNRPYYNRGDVDDSFESRVNANSPATENSQSSARSNEDNVSASNDKLSTETIIMTNRPKPITDTSSQQTDKVDPTTENIYKLLTFGYVGTYRGSMNNIDNKTSTDKNVKSDLVSKDFSTVKSDKADETSTHGKLSTFMLYETATKPYNSQRPTRRNDDETLTPEVKDKYYYIHNVLRKYPESANQNKHFNNSINQPKKSNNSSTNKNVDMDIQERSGNDNIESAGDSKSSQGDTPRLNLRKPTSSAKTPSVAFQIIPSENRTSHTYHKTPPTPSLHTSTTTTSAIVSPQNRNIIRIQNPSQWAVYDEDEDLPEPLPQRMPSIMSDPHALREMPRPMDFNSLRRRLGKV